MFRRWNPFAEFDVLRREIERVFEGYGRGNGPQSQAAFLPGVAARGYPLVNVSETPEEYTVEALAPGLDPESLEVSVKGNALTMTGEKRALEGVNPEQYHRSERSAGRFVRTLTFDSEVDDKRVAAKYANGLLVVTLAKSENAKPKKVAVSVKS